jgi:hypothetical protein
VSRLAIRDLLRTLSGLVGSSISASILIFLIRPTLNATFAEDEYDLLDLPRFEPLSALAFVAFQSTIIFVMAFVPWLAVVAWTRSAKSRSAAFFVLAGVAIATGWFLMGYLFHFDSMFRDLIFGDLGIAESYGKAVSLALLAVGCGSLGGLTYWAIAGRHSGEWKSNP